MVNSRESSRTFSTLKYIAQPKYKNMKKLIIFTIILAAIMLLPDLAIDMYAPPLGPPVDPSSGGATPIGPTGVPIDGGLGFLAAAGIAYAGKKMKDKKKAKAEKE